MAKSAHTEKPEPDSEGYGTDAKGYLTRRRGKNQAPPECALWEENASWELR